MTGIEDFRTAVYEEALDKARRAAVYYDYVKDKFDACDPKAPHRGQLGLELQQALEQLEEAVSVNRKRFRKIEGGKP